MATQGAAPEPQSGHAGFNPAGRERWRIDSADPVVRDHLVKGRIVAPFAFWLSRTFDALTAAQGMPPREIHQVLVRQPLTLEPGAFVDVDFSAVRDGDANRFEISHGDRLVDGSWRNTANAERPLPAPGSGRARTGEEFYRAAATAGFHYGPFLQRIASLQTDGATWSAALSAAPAGSQDAADRIACWDALLQGGAVLAANGGDTCWAPFRIDRIRLGGLPGSHSLARIVGEWIGDAHGDSRVANVFGIAGSGDVAVEFLGVHYRALQDLAEPAPAPTKAVAKPTLDNILDCLRAAEPASRRSMVVRFIEEQVLEVLAWDETRRGDLARGFVAVGMDSLMAVDLQFRLQAAFKFALPIGHNMVLTSIENLADFMMQKYEELG